VPRKKKTQGKPSEEVRPEAWTFFGEGGARITVAAPTWVDARGWAQRVLHSAELHFTPATWDLPVVELRWMGSDYVRPERRLQYREWVNHGETSDWSGWRDANG